MKTYSTITYSAKTPSVVALGCFDGVHLGHCEVIKTAKSIADGIGVSTTVWTFDEPPKNYFLPKAVPLITDRKQKHSLIKALGVDTLVSVPFTKETANISAENFFVNIIKNKIKAVHIVCGFDYSFGAQGLGNTELLKKLCAEHGVGLTVIDSVNVNGITVSSSAVRNALESGDTETASSLLGRPYAIYSVVIGGQKLARKLGFPTLNQDIPSRLVVPKHGVYVSRITIDKSKKYYYGITNVGIRPTVGGKSLFAETHIFDFSGDLYNKAVKVEFLKFIRPEMKFDGLEELTAQVNKDIGTAKAHLASIQ